MTTGVIRYNIADRGRKFVGQPRNFNIPKVVELLNGGVVQELIGKGDLFGYLGHGVREEYGLFPDETAIANVNGKTQLTSIDPCCRTIYLKAFPDGTIEHEEEFTDTFLGQKAYEWHCKKIGGFSSVFAPNPENPSMFYGFDYVRMPNFDGNRGYVADGAMFDIDPGRITSKQQALLMQERLEERRVVMDSISQKLLIANQQVFAEQELNAHLHGDFDKLQAAYDEAQFQLRDMKFLLSQETPKHEPMLTLSAENWLTESANQSVMDSITLSGDEIHSLEPTIEPFEQDLLGSIFNFGK